MKITGTGLHIETRKNRIEVYTKKELRQKKLYEKQARNFIITGTVLLFALLIFTLGLLVGSSI
jgi:hypothetical protein